MKKYLMFLLILSQLQFTSCMKREVIYKEGSYIGIGEGHIGTIKISLVTDSYSIKEIKVLEDEEIPVIAEIVYKKIPKEVIRKNSGEVEAVTGATYTSRGLIDAINDALNKARINNNQ
ncbi:hypothetical protein Q428_02725 [Fervidicella metallireducens AeB]|uniref:FMN-binding domain-containing protein n=1 Tax=Fervidicella metallireducens AeB TaxID=1403537 RepID=A0A017RXU7_9CLOT|nr:FMN-binding protein [Fervidicella metallireducens]EYE89411.1 hypothetical protein Q428_02725 [Fervidicella metallireducens AeB]